MTKEIGTLREQGRKLALQVKSMLGDTGKREQALKEARIKVAKLKSELRHETAELRRRSGELKQLAAESAHGAAEIIHGAAQHPIEPVAAEPAMPPAPPEPGRECDPNDKPASI